MESTRERGTVSRRRCAVLAVGLLALASASVAGAHRHGRRERALAGAFDYYLLSLSWSPSYCADHRGGTECAGARRPGFIVHGLWPQRERGRIEYCRGADRVDAAAIEGVRGILPSRALAYHEWRAHGSCSGLSPTAYFAQLARAAAQVEIPATLHAPSVARSVAPRVILSEFQRANRALPRSAILVTCGRGSVPLLEEVRLCLNRDLSPRACGAGVREQRCRASLVRILPVRGR